MARTALLLSLVLAGCASDVVLKPAAAAFDRDARSAIATVDGNYTQLVTSFNEVTVGWLADNPQCGFRTTLRLRTAAADAWLKAHPQPGKAFPLNDACLSDAEWALLDDAQQLTPDNRERLVILSRSDFAVQLALVETLADYVGALAEVVDAPAPTIGKDIGDTAASLIALGKSVGDLKSAVTTGAIDSSASGLFADGGPAAGFAKGIGDLAQAIAVIVQGERDAAAIRKLALGPAGDRIPPLLDGIARDADRWSCLQFNGDRLAQMMDEKRMRDRLPTLPREDRLVLYRKFLASRAHNPAQICGDTSAPGGITAPVSPIGRMLRELARTHADLQRIANGHYTPREKRLMANAALNRLAAVFQAAAKTAVVLI